MKNILLLVHDDDGQEARLQVALDATRLMNGHLMCLDVAVPPPALVDDSFGAVAGATLFADELVREADNRTRTEARLTHEDISWDWTDRVGRIVPSILEASRLADLIVVSRRFDDAATPDMRAMAGSIIVRSGKLVLVVFETTRCLSLDHVIVAWNGSASCAAALQRAIPLLSQAARVTLLQIGWPDDAADDRGAAARYLSRHGIHARVEQIDPGECSISKALIIEVVRHNAGLVVAGGFGHARAVEALLGGVTRELLAFAPCPVFLAH